MTSKSHLQDFDTIHSEFHFKVTSTHLWWLYIPLGTLNNHYYVTFYTMWNYIIANTFHIWFEIFQGQPTYSYHGYTMTHMLYTYDPRARLKERYTCIFGHCVGQNREELTNWAIFPPKMAAFECWLRKRWDATAQAFGSWCFKMLQFTLPLLLATME
jgi:hypothetical protein